MKLTNIYITILLVIVLVSGKIQHFHKAEQAPQIENVTQNKEQIKKLFNEKCGKDASKYNPKISQSTTKMAVEQLQAKSSFSIFGKEDLNTVSVDFREGNYWKIFSEHTWTVIKAVLLELVLLVIVFGLFIFCFITIFFRKEKKNTFTEAQKIIIALIMFGFLIAIATQSIYQFNDSSEEKVTNAFETVDCVLLYNALVYLENPDLTVTQNWSGLYTYYNELNSVDTFFTTRLAATPYKELQNAKLASTIVDPLNQAVKSSQSLKQTQTQLVSPDPTATATVNSDFLTGVNTAETKVTNELNATLKNLKPSTDSLTTISTSLSGIAKIAGDYHNKITPLKQHLVDNTFAVSKYAIEAHNKVNEHMEYYSSRYSFLQIFLMINKIVIPLAGAIGFVMLVFLQEQEMRLIGGNLMHFSWCYGSVFFMFYIIVCIHYFFFGVGIQTGACEPIALIRQDNAYINSIWKDTNNAQLKSVMDQCVYNQSSSLESQYDTIGSATLLKDGSNVESALKGFKTGSISAPTDLSSFSTLSTTCGQIEKDYAFALDTKGQTAQSVASSFILWSDYSVSGSEQLKEGGSTCKITQDQFVFTKDKCPKGYTEWTSKSRETIDGKPTCFVIDGTMPTDLSSKRYLKEKFAQVAKPPSGCAPVKNQKLGTTVDQILGKYSDKMGQFQNAVKTQVIPVCAKLTASQKDIVTQVKNSNTQLTTVSKSVTDADKTISQDYTKPLEGLANRLNCSFIKDRYLPQIQFEICQQIEEQVYETYTIWTISCLVFGVYIGLVTFATYHFFRLRVTRSILKSDLEILNNPNMSLSKHNQMENEDYGYTPDQYQQDVEMIQQQQQNQEQEYYDQHQQPVGYN